MSASKTEIGILLNQLRRSFEVDVAHVLDVEAPGNETSKGGGLHWGLRAPNEQVADLGDDEVGDAQRNGNGAKPGGTRRMVGIVDERGSDQRPRVDDDRDQANPSASRSSSAALAETRAWRVPRQ